MKKPLIILTGPTAVGKTKLSIALAKAVNGEIISADSMQVYRYMDIGTAKIKQEEMDGVPHYLVNELDPDEEFHVVEFQKRAKVAMETIYSKGKIPIIVGGTGFYIQAIVNDIDFSEADEDTAYRLQLHELAEENGNQYLHQMLEQVDPESAKSIHYNNVKKVIRALEFYHHTGLPISKHNLEQSQKESPYNFAYFVLNQSRELLYKRIEERIDIMIRDGLIDEVSKLKNMGYTKELVSMQGLGYKEILYYLNNEISLQEALYRLKRDTRHFAKRQITWFKREKEVIWLNREEFSSEYDILIYIKKILKEKQIYL